MQAHLSGLLSAIFICTLVSARVLPWDLHPYLVPRNGNNTYVLQDFYQGDSFFKEWTFFTQPDPTNGNVDYLDLQDAQAQHLAYVKNNVTVLAVDSTSQVPVGGQRKSVRITSNKSYNGGLFILDVVTIPTGCGLWPSFWSFGPSWPMSGEIDVVEGVNNLMHNQMTLHTGSEYTCQVDPANGDVSGGNGTSPEPPTGSLHPTSSLPPASSFPPPTSLPPTSNWPPISSVPPCSSPPLPAPTPLNNSTTPNSSSSINLTSGNPVFSGHVLTANCDTAATANEGCGIQDTDPDSFGPGFNNLGGGVFALLWSTTNGIRIWRFSRSNVPLDIINQNPEPAGWGIPQAAWGTSTCDISSNFKNHQLVFDTTICGDWAGASSAYESSGCPGTCSQIVANASNFVDAKWEINSVSVYL